MDAVWASGQTYVEGREFMFHDMPARKGMLAGHWSEQDDRRGLGAQRGRSFDHGHAFDFYGANLERKFGSEWRTRWRDETLARLKAWGFNTLGNWSDPDLWAMHRLPYTVPLSPQGEYAKISSGEDWWGLMPDPFDPRFATAADRMARKAAVQFNSDPYLIGYFVDNELNWGQGWSKDPGKRYSIAIGSLAAGPDSPAKSDFIAQLAQTYREPERLGKTWGIPLSSWDDLRRTGFALPQASLNNPAVVGDLSAFTQRFAETYFRIVAEALHRYDPHHLYLGSRFAWGAHWFGVPSTAKTDTSVLSASLICPTRNLSQRRGMPTRRYCASCNTAPLVRRGSDERPYAVPNTVLDRASLVRRDRRRDHSASQVSLSKAIDVGFHGDHAAR